MWKGDNMRKTMIILSILFITSLLAANAVTYDSSEEIIERLKLEMKHK